MPRDVPGRESPWWILLAPRRRSSPWIGQLIAVGLAAISAGIWFFLHRFLPGAPFNTFFPFIIVAAALGGRSAGFALMAWGVLFAIGVWLSIRPVSIWGGVIASVVFVGLGSLTIAIVHALQSLVAALERAEGQADVMAREMRHRVGNLMQLVQAIAQMTARSSTDLAHFMPRFEGRLRALAEAHQVSAGDRQLSGDLETLLRLLLCAYDPERLQISGPKVMLDADVAPRLALVIHELATNAAKYGALSVTTGIVKIDWQQTKDMLELLWREQGGPPVSAPGRTGFGSRLIAATVATGQGTAEFDYAETGLLCRLQLSLRKTA
ncbi:sensor histidine kinase [Rhizobium sp. SL86]|uniref:sensor histidine kinase n=1 Tax=Rhizobium sp. SL86 TaxID=2995148 RepID=UPI0022733CED|nr:sensor histidine kinase [Rhizobium sp. SL86]MCY1665497.1 sensor histidine kinase [Rhizobium sp. SL86]